MSKTQDAKQFLTSNFLKLFVLTSLFVFILGAVISALNLRSIEKIYSNKIRENIELQRNEFLNEIAINDEAAIGEHLASLLTELQVDSVQLELNDKKIESGDSGLDQTEAGLFTFFLGGHPSLSIPIANEFSNIKATLSVTYGAHFANFVVFPFLNSALWMFLISLIPFSFVFIVLFWKIDKMLIQPLRKMTLRLSNVQSGDEPSHQIHSLAEISSLNLASKRFQEIERRAVFSELASQVSHDIRSPLSALNMVMGTLKGLPEEKRLIIRSATQRINDIANQLLQKSKPELGEPHQAGDEPVMLTALLDTIISEKRVQYRENSHVHIQGDLAPGFGLFSTANATDLARAVSNLVNNSVEASPGLCEIIVSLESENTFAVISIQDKGKGIPPGILEKLGEKGFSFGKDNAKQGFGLGIHHAKSLVAKLGGKFEITSRLERGTCVKMYLPSVAAPDWFASKIAVRSGQTIVAVDDDRSIHQIWEGRLKNLNLVSFSSAKALIDWMSSNSAKEDLIFLVDFELIGSDINGLELIDRLNIQAKSLLVTSRYDENHVREYAKLLGVKIVPKGLAPFIPIKIETDAVDLPSFEKPSNRNADTGRIASFDLL